DWFSEADDAVAPVAERLVLRLPAAAERDAVADLPGLAVPVDDLHAAPNPERAVTNDRDRGLQVALHVLAVRREPVGEPPGGTPVDHVRDARADLRVA